MGAASAAVFTGLREEGGASLAEAMLCGVPVIVLANGGAKAVAEAGIDEDRVVLVEPGEVEQVTREMSAAMNRFHASVSLFKTPNLDQTHARRTLRSIVENALGREPRVPLEIPPANLPDYVVSDSVRNSSAGGRED